MFTAISLSNGGAALVDYENYLDFARYSWCKNRGGYAQRGRRSGETKMHRLVIQALPGTLVDHINRNRLDNRRENLRITDKRTNRLNSGMDSNNSSGFRGVSWHKKSSKWVAKIKNNGRWIQIGSFKDIEDAATAYNFAARELHGPDAYMNKPKEAK